MKIKVLKVYIFNDHLYFYNFHMIFYINTINILEVKCIFKDIFLYKINDIMFINKDDHMNFIFVLMDNPYHNHKQCAFIFIFYKNIILYFFNIYININDKVFDIYINISLFSHILVYNFFLIILYKLIFHNNNLYILEVF